MSILSRIHLKVKKKNTLVLVFDIGSSSVGGTLFYVKNPVSPKIIFATREPILFKQEINGNTLLSATLVSLEIVASRISLAGLGAPERVFCILSSSWYVSQTRIVHFSKDTPFIFSTKIADSLIEKEIALFEAEHITKHIGTPYAMRPIELKNIKTVLNGYETPKPLDQKAQNLEMTLFISMSSEEVLSNIEETIAKHFHSKENKKIKFSSFVMTSFSLVRDLYPDQESFLLLDIGGEVTDIAMVKKNILRECISFPLGRNFLVRGVASALACSLDEAQSFLSLFKDGHAGDITAAKLSLIVDTLKKEWLAQFQESLANLSNDISIPAAIYITIDKDFVEFFSEIVRTEEFNQYMLTESKFSIFFLNLQALHGLATFEETVVRDPGLITDAIYINRLKI